jgi:hypothetical protein
MWDVALTASLTVVAGPLAGRLRQDALLSGHDPFSMYAIRIGSAKSFQCDHLLLR